MSELEREELESRIKGMSREEKIFVVSLMPSEILADVIKNKLLIAERKLVNVVEEVLK